MFARAVIVVLVSIVLGYPHAASAIPENRQLPYMFGETWWCSQDWNACPGTHCNEKAWDFNWGTASEDEGRPLLAPLSGMIEFAGNTGGSYGLVVLIRYPDGTFDRIAHCKSVVAKKGELVKQGQVVGFCGGSGGWPVHIHVNAQSSSSPSALGSYSLPSTFDFIHNNVQTSDGHPEGCDCTVDNGMYRYTSLNDSVFVHEYDAMGQGGTYGNVLIGIGWSNGYTYNDHYYPDGRAKICYWKRYEKQSGGWYRSGIVYDALGGARKAYTIHTGFWEETVETAGGDGWSENGGPQYWLGMPLTNEYSWNGIARQDFQRGYLKCVNGNVTAHYLANTPGWVGYWDNTFSYLFALAYERSGAANKVGSPSGLVTQRSYGSGFIWVQEFDGGTNGPGTIVYDPRNIEGNTAATNEAYYVYGKFREKWNALWDQGSKWVPTRDWYLSQDPGTWSGAEMPLQNFISRPLNDQHYMLMRIGPPYDVRNGTVEPHSSYAYALQSVSPSGTPHVPRGAVRTVEFQVRNAGTVTWSNDNVNLPGDYVTLKSCDVNGTIVPSFLYDGSWIDQTTPCTMLESTVAPGQTATFRFMGHVSTNAPPGPVSVYFRPVHSVGGTMDGWTAATSVSMNVARRTVLDFDGDGISDVWDRTADGRFLLDYAFDNLDGWDWTGYGYGGSLDTSCPADYDGDGKCDFAMLRDSDRRWFIDYASNGFGAWDVSYGGYGGTYDYPCSADYDGDGKADISVRDADGDWHLDYAANGFGAWDWTGYGYGGIYDRPAPANYDWDGKCDFAVLRNSDRKYLIDYASNGFGAWDVSFGGYGGFADYPCPADFDGDGRADIAVLWTSDRTFRIDHSSGGFGAWAYILGGYGGTGDRVLPGDYDGDGRADIGVYHAAQSQVCFDFWNYQGVTGWNGWDYCDQGQYHPPLPMRAHPVSEEPVRLLSFSIGQNPVQGEAQFRLVLPEASTVSLDVFDVNGRKVGSIRRDFGPGEHEVPWECRGYPTGMYLVRFSTKEVVQTKKIVLLR